MKKIALLALMLFAFAGCATYGNTQITKEDVVSKIKQNESTKADVRGLVGEPAKITFTDNSEEVWDYTYSRMETKASTFIPFVGLAVGGANMEAQTLTVRFNKDGVVKEIGKGKTVGSGGGLFD